MLGQPYSMLLPEVIGVRLNGKLKEGVTATDLVLTVTQMLRKRGVVGKFVEFFGPGLANLTIADRATIGNMSPEYGATCGFFPIDDDTIRYLRDTGRPAELIALVIAYAKAQGMYRTKNTPDPVFTDVLKLELSSIEPSLAGPKRPQDRIALKEVKNGFASGDGQGIQQGRRDGQARAGRRPQAHARPRRRGDRGDHVLHQHLEPERDDRGRLARPEGGGEGPHGQAVGQDVARARLAGGGGILSRSRGCRSRSTRSASISSASAAPPASAIRARCRRRFPRRSTRTTWWRPRCSPAIATSKAASMPTCAPTISRRRRWSSPMRSPARCRSMSPSAARHRPEGPQGLFARHLAVEPRDRVGHQQEHQQADVHAQIWRRVQGRRQLAQDRGQGRPDLQVGRSFHLRAEPALFRRHAEAQPADRGHRRRAHPRPVPRLDHDRPHLAGRLDQGGKPGRRISARSSGPPEGLQPVRHAARQSPGDDARHLRQYPHQESDGARRRGRLHDPLSVEAAHDDLRRGDALQERRTCRWSCSPARNTAPARRAIGRPKARSCSACAP